MLYVYSVGCILVSRHCLTKFEALWERGLEVVEGGGGGVVSVLIIFKDSIPYS